VKFCASCRCGALKFRASCKNRVQKFCASCKIGVNEGMLTEDVVTQMLVAAGHKLFFYSKSGKAARACTA
jgi:hypothetical protein